MYRIIFPNEKVPSPCMPAPLFSYAMSRTHNAPDYETNSSAVPKPGSSHFQSTDECKDFLRAEIQRVVRPAMERYVTGLLTELQEKVDRKTVEIIHDVETKALRTFYFQEEQSSLSALAAAAHVAKARPPPDPVLEMSRTSAMLEDLSHVPSASDSANLIFDWEGFLGGAQHDLVVEGCGSWLPADSAYYTW